MMLSSCEKDDRVNSGSKISFVYAIISFTGSNTKIGLYGTELTLEHSFTL